MRVIGLTGGVATGKSTVSAMLRELGAPVLDADEIARQVVEPGQPALEEVRLRFPGVVDAAGRLDRQALGARVFNDPKERAALNAITHPRIQEAFLARTQALAAQGATLVVYDAPLLIENQLHRLMDGVIVVTAPPDVQLARLRARNPLTEAEAKARIASQLPLAEKVAHATWVVDNGGDRDATRRQVEAIWRVLQRAP